MGDISWKPLLRCPRGKFTQEKKKAAAERVFGCKLLTTREVAELYDLSAHQVMNKVRAGLLPRPVKFQNCNYFIKSQHVAYKAKSVAAMRAQVRRASKVAA